MPGPWKPWKTKPRFPTVPTAPWKSPKTLFPHSHSTDDGSYIFRLQTTLAPFRRLPSKARIKERSHPQLPARCREGRPLSGSSRIGIEVQFHAHLALE